MGLIPKTYRELLQLNNKTNKSDFKMTKEFKRHFSKEDIQMAHRHLRRCSISLFTEEMQIKITMKNHFASIISKSIFLKKGEEAGVQLNGRAPS